MWWPLATLLGLVLLHHSPAQGLQGQAYRRHHPILRRSVSTLLNWGTGPLLGEGPGRGQEARMTTVLSQVREALGAELGQVGAFMRVWLVRDRNQCCTGVWP